MVLEQFLDTVPDEVRVFVKEIQPAKYSEEAGKLVDDFVQARKQNVQHHDDRSGIQGRNPKRHMQCNQCGWAGHLARDCRSKLAKSQEEEKGQQSIKQGSGKHKRDLKDIECFICHLRGHY